MTDEDWPPLREELRGVEPYGAPQLDVPVQLNVNENPYPPSQAVIDDIAAAVAEAAATLNRYPDREFTELRKGLAAYLADGVGRRPDPRPDLGGQRVQRGDAADPAGLRWARAGPRSSFAPTYSMYPEYARDAMTTWVAGRRHEDFSFDFDEARRLIDEHRPSVILLPSPNNPTGTALPHEVIGQLLLRWRPGSW